MLPFLHDRLAKLDALLARSNVVLVKYNDADLDTAPALSAYLDEGIGVYRALNRGTVENHLLALKADHVSALHGTNPLTFERLATNRRAMQRAIALRVLQSSTSQLRGDIEGDRRQLADGTALLRPIVLAGIQKGIVEVHRCGRGHDYDVVCLWRELTADEDIGIAARQLAMLLSVYDIQILLQELLDVVH